MNAVATNDTNLTPSPPRLGRNVEHNSYKRTNHWGKTINLFVSFPIASEMWMPEKLS